MPSGKTPNEHIRSGDWKRVPVPEKVKVRGRFSYAGVCETTLSEKQSGQLWYKLGHAGAGVAFSSGLGDGVYDVYATYADVEGWGRRIVSVRIDLIHPLLMKNETTKCENCRNVLSKDSAHIDKDETLCDGCFNERYM
jgi:hypothetical protein